MNASLRRLSAVAASSAATGITLFGQFLLQVDPCDGIGPCRRPVFDIHVMVAVFVLLSWLTVFPATLLAARVAPRFLAPVVATLLATILIALSDTPALENSGFVAGFVNMAEQLSLPWLVGNTVAVWLWPNKSDRYRVAG